MSSKSGPSRFSTLKAFKFSGAKTPPPVPSKDLPLYLKSTPSFSHPPAGSQPPTPVSPNHTRASYTSQDVPAPSSPVSASLSPESHSSTFKNNLIRLAKRSLTPKSPNRSTTSSLDTQDDGISMPWNFQHNIHVDESYNGLPPTWSASLANLGYSEHEIEAIQYRRAASRSPSTNPYQFSESPPNSTYSISTNPKPRSDSLRRQASLGSRRPKYAPRQSSDTNTSYHSSEHSSADPHIDLPPLPTAQPVHLNDHATQISVDNVSHRGPDISVSQPSTSTWKTFEKGRPRTPPQRTFRVMNGTTPTSSPPPAYRSPGKNAPANTVDESALSSSGLPHAGPSTQPLDKKLPSSLPRLSLGRDAFADITSWTESLLSSVSGSTGLSSDAVNPRPPPNKGSSTSFSPARSQELLHKPGSVPPQNSRHDLEPFTNASSMSKNPRPQNVVDTNNSEEDSPASPSGPASISQILGASFADDNGLKPGLSDRGRENRDSNISSSTVTNATIVRGVEVATMARANVITSPPPGKENGQHLVPQVSIDTMPDQSEETRLPAADEEEEPLVVVNRSPSPAFSCNTRSSFATSSSSSSTRSATRPSSLSSESRPHTTSVLIRGGSKWEVDSQGKQGSSDVCEDVPDLLPLSKKSQFGPTKPVVSFVDFDNDDSQALIVSPPHPSGSGSKTLSIRMDDLEGHEPGQVSGVSTTSNMLSPWAQGLNSISPAQRYRGWLSEVLASLDEFIDDKVDPRDSYKDLKEIAEGESGYVYQARVVRTSTLLPPDGGEGGPDGLVAIKAVPISPSGSPKLSDLKKELDIMRDVRHAHVLTMDGLYVDLVEDSLWIKMELMEKSLADVVALVEEGLVVQEKVIARFASDMVVALIYLQKLAIAHRDIRSDNLLLNKDGVLKIADFSNAVKVTPEEPTCSDMAGVIYWQAPEVRRGCYNPLKADVWSLGATVWEIAQAEPPFNDATDASDLDDRWPTLRQPETYSRSFHDFLQLCSHPVISRPNPEALLTTPFVRSAARRSAVIQLLGQCKSIEQDLQRREHRDSQNSQGTISH